MSHAANLQTNTDSITTDRSPAVPASAAAVVSGFGIALAVWCAWFATHLPWVGVPERTATFIVLGVWLAAAVVAGRGSPRVNPLVMGPLAGLLSAALGLLLVGTRLNVKAPGIDALAQPGVIATIGAFLGLGTVLGTVGVFIGSRLRPPTGALPRQVWLARMGLITAIAIAPLLFIGGLVTSTNAGMAVPDWPNTYGANMFLYPLRPDIAKNFTEGMNYTDVFLEHSHRLFGSFIGVCAIGLMIFTLAAEPRRWVKGLAIGLFLLVCVQGVLGGKRVLFGSHVVELDNRWWSMLHGILGQLVFAVAIALAVVLMPSWRNALDRGLGSLSIGKAKLLRICATGAMHATVLQLVFGAMYRHHRHDHALYAHIGFSVVVLVMAMLAGIAATTATGTRPIAARVKTVGVAALVVVMIQFTLGWVAFLAGGSGIEAKSTFEALLRTAHQANGAVFLALAVAMWLFAKRAIRAQ